MKFRKGDKVSVIGIIKFEVDSDDGTAFVTIEGEHREFAVSPERLTLVEPLFLEGDDVSFVLTSDQAKPIVSGQILSIRDGHAWIIYGDGHYCTRTLTSITRVFHEEIPA